MNTEANTLLKVHVERIVRPIVAVESEKLKMRQELLAHVLDAFEYERSTGRSVEQAMQRAVERLGDPEVMRAELQSTVKWTSRIGYLNDQVLRRKPGVSLVRHASRVALLTFCAFVPLLLAIVVPLEIVEIWNWTFKGQLLVRFLIGYALMFSVGMFVGAILSDFAWQLADRGYGDHGDVLRGVGIVVAAQTALLVLGWSFTYAISGDYEASLSIAWRWLLLAIVISPAFLLLSWFDVRQRKPLVEWYALDLEQAVEAE